jgi:acyl-CoA thioester hydrolase
MPTIEQLESLPLFHRDTISDSHLDVMGHMNVRHYMALFDDAAWRFFASFGMDEPYCRSSGNGGFALQHFVQYLAEVRAGETVAIRSRVLARSAKRIHFMHFMINETTGKLAATLEVLGAHADMNLRRIAPYPAPIAEKIDAILLEQRQLDWQAPVCGVIRP